MMGMEVESTSGLLQQTLISFVQNFLFSCPLLSAFLCYRLASSLFVTCHFGSFQSRCASSGWKYPLFPKLSEFVNLFLGNTPSSALGYKWLRLKILCFPFNLA